MATRDVPPARRDAQNRPPDRDRPARERPEARARRGRWVAAAVALTGLARGVRSLARTRPVHVEKAFTIDRPAQELYERWHRLEELPRILSHLERVRVLEGNRSEWVAKAPRLVGGFVTWRAETTADVPGERIAWRSLPGSEIDHAGSVRFERSARGTIVRVELTWSVPAGRLGGLVAKMLGDDPETQLREDLRSFKRIMETGEAVTTVGQSHGTCTQASSKRGGRR